MYKTFWRRFSRFETENVAFLSQNEEKGGDFTLKSLDFDYFYGGESQQFSFYRIPRQLIVGPEFKHVSTDAKLLYGLMLDRMGLSARNGWYDELGRVFIYFPVEEIREALNCGNDKAIKLLAELDGKKGVGLIQRVKQGQGRPTRVFVKKFASKEAPAPDIGKPEVQTSVFPMSRPLKSRSADLGKTDASYIKENYLESNQSNLSIHRAMDRQSCREEVMENIGFESIAEQYGPEDAEGMADLITDVLCSTQAALKIGGEAMPAQAVKERFRRLDQSHIEYVLDALQANTSKIHNIRGYLLASLYNAPATIGPYYQARVRSDLYGAK